MLLVRVALILVAVATTVAGILGDVADQTPDGGVTAPPVCVSVPGGQGLQAGYCP